MHVSRRHFLGATSGAATLSALAARTAAQAPADPLSDPLGVRRDFPAEGRWVVTVAGVSTTGAVTSVAVLIKEQGFDRASIKFVPGKLVRQDVEEMIQ